VGFWSCWLGLVEDELVDGGVKSGEWCWTAAAATGWSIFIAGSAGF
jgi:hypothetical protein